LELKQIAEKFLEMKEKAADMGKKSSQGRTSSYARNFIPLS